MPSFRASSRSGVMRAVGPDAVAAQPAGCRQFEHAREAAIVGQQQQPFRVDVEPADRDQARQVLGQIVEHGRPALRILGRRHQAARLVVEEQARPLARLDRRGRRP